MENNPYIPEAKMRATIAPLRRADDKRGKIWRRRESNRILALKWLNLLIPGIPGLAEFPGLPDLLYGHCTVFSQNSSNSQTPPQTVPFGEKSILKCDFSIAQACRGVTDSHLCGGRKSSAQPRKDWRCGPRSKPAHKDFTVLTPTRNLLTKRYFRRISGCIPDVFGAY